MKKNESVRGYRVMTAPTNSGGGRCVWAFAEKGGRHYFIKQFLDPKWPTESSMGSPAGKARRRAECERFAARHQAVNTRINPTAVGGGNLVTAIDFFLDGSSFYKVTDRVEAVSVADLRGFSRRQAAVVLRTLCQSIKLLHRAGIVHGDLKPANVLLQQSKTSGLFTAKVIDFDDSYPSGDPPPPDEVVGDQLFGAPEWLRYVKQDAGDARLTTAADIFALGLVFHVYLCGDLPGFDRSAFAAPAEAVYAGGALATNPGLEERMRALLGRMLAAEPGDRPAVEEVIAVLADDTVIQFSADGATSAGTAPTPASTETTGPVDPTPVPVAPPASPTPPTPTPTPPPTVPAPRPEPGRTSRVRVNLGSTPPPAAHPPTSGPRIRNTFDHK
jgi:serine/threonine protein kinase